MRKVDFSVVVPVYYNDTTLEYTEDRIRRLVLEKVPWKGEIVFVDDGSGDRSFEVLCELQKRHPADIRVFKLSRNFGQVNALWCGMSHSPNAVVQISADGQDPIDLIPEMLDRHFNQGKEIVIARRASRDETAYRRWSSRLVYYFIKRLSNADMPVGGFDFLLIGDKARREYLRVWQPNTFMQVRILDLGYSRDWIPYHRADRKGGVSKWTLARKITYTLDAVLGHSYVPIRLMSVVGIAFSGLSFLLGLFFFLSYLCVGQTIRGWTPIVLLILFIGGLQMSMIGVVGEYLWRVLAQVRGNAPYLVEKVIDETNEAA